MCEVIETLSQVDASSAEIEERDSALSTLGEQCYISTSPFNHLTPQLMPCTLSEESVRLSLTSCPGKDGRDYAQSIFPMWEPAVQDSG